MIIMKETLYDVDCVQRIHLLARRIETLMLVGKLIDGYLSEIAFDANLKPEKFLELAFALPETTRLYDDGLYRSVDVYLKAHPWLPEADREKICGVLDCRKLTLEVCTHAAQNEQLPLRAVVQVLFFEQLQLRQAIAGMLMSGDIGQSNMQRPQEVLPQDEQERGVGSTWPTAVKRIRCCDQTWIA
ncbi:hypothetical protein E3N88_27385 [Mikania micrantha]|uniref:NPH3 domain-containing protein n=1 Tax=Mikania micrantha TaxID=192012 RepID=A0A5N6MY19_9ASTR|nr:hypothetical protein E3N88_27385 [Mikania micrantha]